MGDSISAISGINDDKKPQGTNGITNNWANIEPDKNTVNKKRPEEISIFLAANATNI